MRRSWRARELAPLPVDPFQLSALCVGGFLKDESFSIFTPIPRENSLIAEGKDGFEPMGPASTGKGASL